MKRRKNVLQKNICGEYGVRNNLRHNLNVIKRLICSEDNKYVKIWEKHAKRPIAYEGGKLYLDNYRHCYTICGHRGLPQLLYKLPDCTVPEKIEEAMICQFPLHLEEKMVAEKHFKGSFLALTADNYLVRYDVDTGQQLQNIFLSHLYKFRHLNWNCDGHSVCLKSTHNKMAAVAREAGITQSLLMSLAVFQVFPLEFVGMMEVTKQIFGNDICDSMISQGILIVMHHGGYVRLYSFEHILSMGKRGRISRPDPGRMLTGSGLSINIKLKERPPLLFEVKCSNHSFCLGGIPWHYIITPPGDCGYFNIYSLEDKRMAEDGSLDLETLSIEPDKCLFHPDDSGKILHVGAKQLRVLTLHAKDDCMRGQPRCKVHELYTVSPFQAKPQTTASSDRYSSSGRKIKHSYSYDDEMVDFSQESITTVDYENDLDILFVGLASPSKGGMSGKVNLYDNERGDLIKQVQLEETWREFHEHYVSLDLDTLVHIVKAPMRQYSCYVYRLQRGQGVEDCQPASTCARADIASQDSAASSSRSHRHRTSVHYEET